MRAYKRLRVRLKKTDRDKLDDVLSGGLQPVRTVLRALALSHLHDEKPVSEVAAIVRLTPKAVREIGRRYLDYGLEQALYDKARPGAAPVLEDGDTLQARIAGEKPERSGGEERQPDSGHAADSGEHGALSEQLTHQPGVSHSQRSPDGHLSGASGSAHQHQTGDVAASDQQHQPRGGQHHAARLHQFAANTRRHRRFRQRLQFDATLLIVGGKGLC